MNRINQAVTDFEQGFACSQAVLSAFALDLGLDRDLALRLASGFGGGMGRMGGTCGAVTGALMVLGLRYGNTDAADTAAKERAYDVVRAFADQFQARNGSIVCRELLGYDISRPDARQRARDEGLFTTLCPRLVRDAAEILEALLADSPDTGHIAAP